MCMEHCWNNADKGRPDYSEENCPSATFFTAICTCYILFLTTQWIGGFYWASVLYSLCRDQNGNYCEHVLNPIKMCWIGALHPFKRMGHLVNSASFDVQNCRVIISVQKYIRWAMCHLWECFLSSLQACLYFSDWIVYDFDTYSFMCVPFVQ
jgi:hypothetical protein